MAALTPDLDGLFSPIRGRELGAITFVRDYFQLHFDGPTINVTGSATVELDGSPPVAQADLAFPGNLRLLIGLEVSSVVTDCETEISFHFGRRSNLLVRFPADGEEAIYFHSGKSWFVLPS